MAKLWIMSVLCLVALLQLTAARDLAEALNVNIREQLKGYQKFLAEDDGSHKGDLQKLIAGTETALKANTVEQKQAIMKNLEASFTPEFNKFVAAKLEEYEVNDDIHESMEFYSSLIAGHSEFKTEIEKTIATLGNLLKETNLKQKEESFENLNKAFSPEFEKFLKENALPNVNRELKKTAEFFEDLLVEKDTKYGAEIKVLKAQAEAALADVTIDEKQKALYEVTNPKDSALYEYLQKKFIELH